MHRNRSIYSLPEYQKKLRNSYHKLGLFLMNNSEKKIYCFRPIPNCPWLPESRKKYFGKMKKRMKLIDQTKKYTFLTLTYSRRLYSPHQAAKQIKNHLDLFFKRLDYHHRRFQYFYVIEVTESLMVHIHMICDQYLPWQKVKASWLAVTGNSVTNIKSLPAKQAFWYAVKYIANCKKQSDEKWQFIFKNIDRIWTSSRGFFIATAMKNSRYTFLFSSFDPERSFDSYFSDPENDLISDEISKYDAMYIAGFTDRLDKVFLLHASDDFYESMFGLTVEEKETVEEKRTYHQTVWS